MPQKHRMYQSGYKTAAVVYQTAWVLDIDIVRRTRFDKIRGSVAAFPRKVRVAER